MYVVASLIAHVCIGVEWKQTIVEEVGVDNMVVGDEIGRQWENGFCIFSWGETIDDCHAVCTRNCNSLPPHSLLQFFATSLIVEHCLVHLSLYRS